jgi:NADH-quinone oxidoreductase subunit M
MLLSLAIWVPIIGALAVFVTGRDRDPTLTRWIALIASIAGFLVTLPLVTEFDTSSAALQFVEKLPWIPRYGIHYHLGVDGISVWFVLLNSLMTIFVVIAGWYVIEDKQAQYYGAFLVMSGLINGAFAAADAALFYVFFEAMLIPMYLIIGIWGGPNRVYAAVKFFLYTLLGSLLMLVALIYLYNVTGGSFEISQYHKVPLAMGVQILLFVAFFLAFAVKVPMWPVHTWLPDAHVEAPTGGSVILAAITLKLGAYGFLRFILPIVPDASRHLAPLVIVLSLIAIVYIGFVALVQTDMKKLVAYSSISHMGFVTLGFFLFTANGEASALGIEGGLLQMISHGFVSGAMFLCIGVLYDRLHSRNIADYGGVVNTMPKFAALMMLFAMANAGLPGTSGFIGEFTVTLAAVKQGMFWTAAAAGLTLVLGAAYTLWMYKRVIFGDVANDNVRALTDVTPREFWMLMALALLVLAMGLYPAPFTEIMQKSVHELVLHVAKSKL